jgi:hypothetical protein
MAGQPHAGRGRADRIGSGSGDPVWLRLKVLNVFLFPKISFFPLKNPRKSILTPKIVKPLPENF